MKKLLNSWTTCVILTTSPVVLAFVLTFGFHWRWLPPITGYPFPFPIIY